MAQYDVVLYELITSDENVQLTSVHRILAKALSSSSTPSPTTTTTTTTAAAAAQIDQESLGGRIAQRAVCVTSGLSFTPKQKHKWLGAARLDNGNILGVPAHAPYLLSIGGNMTDDIDDHAQTTSQPADRNSNNHNKGSIATVIPLTLEKEAEHGKFKWLRGIVVNGAMYCLPCWADGVRAPVSH